jgi:hypothetical protein
MKLLAIFLSAILLAAAPPPPPGANLGLASALIASGGGPGSYSTVRAFTAMVGQDSLAANQRQLATQFGKLNADIFMRMFDYTIADAWQLAGKDNVSIPPASQTGGPALASALVQAGVSKGNIEFDTNTFFTQLFGAKIAGQIQNDTNAKFGSGAWDDFSRMSNQFFHNVGQTAGMNV